MPPPPPVLGVLSPSPPSHRGPLAVPALLLGPKEVGKMQGGGSARRGGRGGQLSPAPPPPPHPKNNSHPLPQIFQQCTRRKRAPTCGPGGPRGPTTCIGGGQGGEKNGRVRERQMETPVVTTPPPTPQAHVGPPLLPIAYIFNISGFSLLSLQRKDGGGGLRESGGAPLAPTPKFLTPPHPRSHQPPPPAGETAPKEEAIPHPHTCAQGFCPFPPPPQKKRVKIPIIWDYVGNGGGGHSLTLGPGCPVGKGKK